MEETTRKKLWASSSEIANAKIHGYPHTRRGVNKYGSKYSWLFRERLGKGGGKEWYIGSDEVLRRHFNPEEENDTKKLNDIDFDAELYTQAPVYNRKKADQYLWIIRRDPGVKGKLKTTEFLDGLRLEYPGRFIPSVSAYYQAKRKYRHDGMSGLLGQYGKNAGNSKTDPEYLEWFTSVYLSQNCPSANTCRKMVLGKFGTPENIDSFPTSRTLRRQTEKKFGKSVVYLKRYGEKKWRQKYGNYNERDYDNLKAGQCWVGDHAELDVIVGVGQKKHARVWITAWSDMRTGKILSILSHIEPPNSDHIFQSFYHAVMKFGLPEVVYIDNGKDYRSRDLSGGRKTYRVQIDEERARSMLALLKVEVRRQFKGTS